MALSNIFREPRREIIETAFGAGILMPIFVPDYFVAQWVTTWGPPDDKIPFPVGLFLLGPMILTLAFVGVLGLAIFVHYAGERVCDYLDNRGWDPRPTERYGIAWALVFGLGISQAHAWTQDQAQHQRQAQQQSQHQTQRQGQHQSATGGSASASGGQASSSAYGGGGYGGNVNIGLLGTGSTPDSALALTNPGGYGNAPCGGGIGLGGLGLSGGGSGGGTLWEFTDCKRLRESAALLTLGYRDAATAELCQIDRIREAFGGTCPAAHMEVISNAGPPDYCFTRNAGDRNQHRECDRSMRVAP